jgi:hypothetical protein
MRRLRSVDWWSFLGAASIAVSAVLIVWLLVLVAFIGTKCLMIDPNSTVCR